MSKKSVSEVGEVIVENKQALTYIVLLGAGIFVLNKLIKGVTKSFRSIMAAVTSNNEEEEKEYKEAVTSEKKALLNEGVTPSFSLSQFQDFAQRIYSKFNTGGGWTEDEKGIADILAVCNNDLDVLLLIESFGFKRIYFTTTYSNLNGWIAKYFTGKTAEKYIEAVNLIYQKKGIKYRF